MIRVGDFPLDCDGLTDDADDELLLDRIDADDERVVHDVCGESHELLEATEARNWILRTGVGQEQAVVVDRGADEALGRLADVERVLVRD